MQKRAVYNNKLLPYLLLAPQIVGRVDIYKTPEARIDEGSIGGTVIVQTRKPFDLKSPTIAGSVGYLYNDRSKKDDFQGALIGVAEPTTSVVVPIR